jgi:hypothetical protein
MQQVTVTDTALGIEGPLHRQRSVHAAMYQAGFVAAHFIPQFIPVVLMFKINDSHKLILPKNDSLTLLPSAEYSKMKELRQQKKAM